MFKVKWVAGVAMLVCSGALVACGDSAETPSSGASGSATPPAAVTPTVAATPTVSMTPSSPATPSTAAPSKPAGSKSAAAGAPAPVLSGKREVTIVRVQSTESGVSLDDNELAEVDDDSGRQLFVPTPTGGGKYLIKSYGTRDGHPANDDPACWEVITPDKGGALTVEGAACDPRKPAQQFTIASAGKGAYAISNNSAFLQFSPSRGLILEELGDATLRSTFRLVDVGPARTPIGG